MSYLVIARKWRPLLFGDLIGQSHVTRTLKNAVTSGRTAHAYLFSGPRGVGKTTAARILAKSVNCKAPQDGEPCNECENCKAITNGSSMDCIEIDGASNTGVDSVRELRDSIKFVPASSAYKVYIIDEVHMLSTAAFNALLKTLEEPPPHVIFIFATTEVHKIPRTILSRCQRFDFKRIPFAEISAHLRHILDVEKIKATDEVLDLITREADGSLRDAQSLLDQTIAYAGSDIEGSHVFEALGLMDRTLLFDLAASMLKKDGHGCLKIVEKVYNFGYDLKSVSLEILELIRDLTIVKVTGDASLLEMPESETKRLLALSAGVSMAKLQMLFQIFTMGFDEISRSETQRFSLEMTLLRAVHTDEMRPIGELIEELKGLKLDVVPKPSSTPVSKPVSKPVKEKAADSGVDTKPRASVSESAKDEPEESPVLEDKPVSDEPCANGDFTALFKAIKAKDSRLHDFLVGTEFKFDGKTLTITLGKSKGFMIVKEEVLTAVCKEFYSKPITLIIVEGQQGEAKSSKSSETLVDDALKIFGGQLVESR